MKNAKYLPKQRKSICQKESMLGTADQHHVPNPQPQFSCQEDGKSSNPG